MLDDGRITDSQGRTVDFKNTVIIMTSNIGSAHLLDGLEDDGSIKEESRELVMGQLRGHFRPEFLNRVDEIILFKPLTTNEIKGIVDKIVKELQGRLADRHITVELTDAAKEFVVEAGFDPMYGARPLKRYVQRQVETKLARELIAGTIIDNSHVVVDVENNELVVHVEMKIGCGGGFLHSLIKKALLSAFFIVYRLWCNFIIGFSVVIFIVVGQS